MPNRSVLATEEYDFALEAITVGNELTVRFSKLVTVAN
jgi:hypothetical protein